MRPKSAQSKIEDLKAQIAKLSKQAETQECLNLPNVKDTWGRAGNGHTLRMPDNMFLYLKAMGTVTGFDPSEIIRGMLALQIEKYQKELPPEILQQINDVIKNEEKS